MPFVSSRLSILLSCLLLAVAVGRAEEAPPGVSYEYRGAVQARISGSYAVVINADGTKNLVPLASLRKPDLDWINHLAATNPAAKGKSTVKVVAASSTVQAKTTVVTAKTENGIETVQLCPPSLARDQIGGTCMLYARVNWLDIAGYPVATPDIYKIINGAPPDSPWDSPVYVSGLSTIITGRQPRPVMHRVPVAGDGFDWARGELRKGRPLLAALPREIWQALPPGFIAQHPWNGGSVGHQIVVNGFTYDPVTRKGTFHVVNTWAELPEFDLTLEAAGHGNLVFEASMSRLGEAPEAVTKEVVRSVSLVRAAGSTNLYEVTTNLGSRRILAPNEEAARRMVEEGP